MSKQQESMKDDCRHDVGDKNILSFAMEADERLITVAFTFGTKSNFMSPRGWM